MPYHDDKPDTYSPITGTVLRVSEKAIHLMLDDGQGMFWIPKSLCQNSAFILDQLDREDQTTLRVVDWFLEKEGIVA